MKITTIPETGNAKDVRNKFHKGEAIALASCLNEYEKNHSDEKICDMLLNGQNACIILMNGVDIKAEYGSSEATCFIYDKEGNEREIR